MSVADTKPEPIRVGVEGIAPKPLVLTPERPRIDWAHLAALPPFQMFMAERRPGSMAGKDSFAAAFEAALTLAAQSGDAVLLDEYATWHTAKGYWPGETHLGEPKG